MVREDSERRTTRGIYVTLTDEAVFGPQNRTSRSTVDSHAAAALQSDIRYCVHTFIHAVGRNLSVFPAEGIRYRPDS